MYCFFTTVPVAVVGVADVINHGNDRSREYKVTDGRILACSVRMACRL